MQPSKKGQIAKYYSNFSAAEPEQLYVILEILYVGETQLAEIQGLNTGLEVPPINRVNLNELEVMEVSTNDLIGIIVKINKSDYSQVYGKVISVNEQKVNLNLSEGIKGVETNVILTVVDKNGKKHMGTLFVN